MSATPVVDIASLAEPESAAAAAAAGALCGAYEDLGFAYIVGHGVERGLVDACFAASAGSRGPLPGWSPALAINGFHRGYLGFAGQPHVTSTVARNTKPNLS